MGFINSIIQQGLIDQDYVDNHSLGFTELKARAAEFAPDYVEKVTGVKAADVEKFAREFATVQPSVIRLGVALERSAGGGQVIRRGVPRCRRWSGHGGMSAVVCCRCPSGIFRSIG